MLTLGTVPDTTDAQFYEGASVLWPARDANRLVLVQIRICELSEYDGTTFGVDTAKIKAALERHCEFIQARARSKYRQGDESVTLDVGDLTLPPKHLVGLPNCVAGC
jgi:hypothetical protein